MTVRKNFLLDEEIAEHLAKIAQLENVSQTQVIKEMIEQRFKEIEKVEKISKLKRLKGHEDTEFLELGVDDGL